MNMKINTPLVVIFSGVVQDADKNHTTTPETMNSMTMKVPIPIKSNNSVLGDS